MAFLDPRQLRLGGRILRPAPEAWLAGLARHGQDVELLALAEGVASFAVEGQADATFREGAVLLALLLLVAQADGHACLPLQPATLDPLAADFGADPHALRDLVRDPRLAPILGAPGARRPILLDRDCLYAERMQRAEASLAARIMARQDAPDASPLAFDPAVLEAPAVLSGEQREAVAAALARPLTLITGGPGTGKTSIVVAILRAALGAGLAPADLALAAPTGKAAHRMGAALRDAAARIGRPGPADLALGDPALAPRTLHRLLGYRPEGERFRFHEANPLAARLVVVDETSMVDLVLLDRLLRALAPGARLVLIGDADQLPSVEAGTVFRDLVAELPGAAVRLTRSFRMEGAGAAILAAAAKVQGGAPEALFEEPHPVAQLGSVDERQGCGVELLEVDEGGMEAFLARWLAREVEGVDGFDASIRHVHRIRADGWLPADLARLQRMFSHLDRARILCPLKDAPRLRGSRAINAWLHAEVQERRDLGLEKRLAFSLGEPVMMTRNDYRRGIFNGDPGLMLLVARDRGEARLEAVFPAVDGFRAFAAGPLLGDLELAYALTVHKAQGSEFDRVALVLPEQDSPLATREVLYTALTRARQGATVVGGRTALERAAARGIPRWSGFAARLQPEQSGSPSTSS